MPPRNRRLRGLDDQPLNIWKVKPFVELTTALTNVRALSVPHRPLGLITAPAGFGKTFTAQVFAHAHDDVVIVRVPPAELLTLRRLLDEIAVVLGINPDGFRYSSPLFDALVDDLQRKDRFVIADEADRLRPGLADVLRELSELSGRALCYLGCPRTNQILARVPATHHRIGFFHTMLPVTMEDVLPYLIGLSLDSTGSRRLDEPTAKQIFKESGGNLRHIETLCHQMGGANTNGRYWDVTPGSIEKLQAKYQFQKAA